MAQIIYKPDGKTVETIVDGISDDPTRNIPPGVLVGPGWIRQDDGSFRDPERKDNLAYPVSQDTILRRLEAMGKTLAFLDVLDRPEPPFRKAKAFFFASKFLMSDDPLFSEFAPMVKQAVGLTDAEFAAVIAPEDDCIL